MFGLAKRASSMLSLRLEIDAKNVKIETAI